MAQSCIAEAFHVDPTNKAAVQDAIGGQSLLSIYGVYEKLKGRSAAASAANTGAARNLSQESQPSTPPISTATTNPEAEALKSQGNAAMQRKDYPLAIDFYSKAIAITPLNPIYLSNRAAAYSASNKHSEAQTDAELAVAADPKYTKAWSRLGLARFVLGDAKGSMEAYAKGIEYEGNGGSEAMKKGYRTAKEKADEEEKEKQEEEEDNDELEKARSGGAGAAGGAGGMPDLSALAGMLGGGGRGGGGGGPDLSSIMNNPMFASMAQNLMSNPDALNNLMSNPQLRQMAESFGLGGAGSGGGGGRETGAGAAGPEGRGGAGGGRGGGGGMPDISALLQDPNIAEM